jgi:hypothetical protein
VTVAVQSRWHLGEREHRDVVVTLPIRTVSETNQREHWARRHRRRREQRQTVALVLAGALAAEGMTAPCSREDAPGTRFGVRMVPRAVQVTIARLAPSSGLDGDNLVSSLKAVRDGVADALGVDDADDRVTWSYEQRRSKRGSWAVEIRIARRVTA